MRIQTTSGGGFDRMHIKSMRIHVNATDPDRMRIRCASRCPCESAFKDLPDIPDGKEVWVTFGNTTSLWEGQSYLLSLTNLVLTRFDWTDAGILQRNWFHLNPVPNDTTDDEKIRNIESRMITTCLLTVFAIHLSVRYHDSTT